MKTSNEIKKEIRDALKRNTIIGSCDIDVDVMCNTVYLSGKVDSYRKRFEAGDIARKIEDVKKVQLDIYVALPREAKRSDAQIKDKIKNILHASIVENEVSVRVYDGIVVLTGETNSEQQKLNATKIILDVEGIENVWNFIRIRKNEVIIINNNENKAVNEGINARAIPYQKAAFEMV